jgi:tRNA G18 (ribose-2'-O)-methylase SpoU
VIIRIDDVDDPRLDDYTRLKDADLRSRGDAFLVEGVLAIRRAIELGVELRSALLTPRKLAVLEADLGDTTVFLAEQALMDGVTGFAIHRGAIASAVPPTPPPLDELLAASTTIAVLEGVNDLENLGSLFRNAAAFGIDAVLLDPTTADPLYRRAVRVSLGHVLAVPHRRVDDLAEVRRHGFELVALTPDPEAEPIQAIPQDGKVALLLGAEGPGLTDAALRTADRKVRIPMVPGIDSLNVATAAAIAFHHRAKLP